MKPFLEIPVCLQGGHNEDEKVVTARVQPSEIAYHYPGYHWGAVVVFRSGSSLLTSMSSDELDLAILGYESFQKKNPNNRHNIKLTAKPKPDESNSLS